MLHLHNHSNLQALKYYTTPTQPSIFKQVTNQSKRYTYTTYNFQANNKSIKTLHLRKL